MKNQELFHKTVNILVQAYLNNSLIHCDCSACMVGNLVASNMGIKMSVAENYFNIIGAEWIGEEPHWHKVFYTQPDTKKQIFKKTSYRGKAKKQIESTGYSLKELAKMEYVFETAPGFKTTNYDPQDEEWMFNGLMAVIDVLCDIHEMNDEAKQEAKALFIKA